MKSPSHIRSFVRKVFSGLRLYKLGAWSVAWDRMFWRLFRYKTIIIYSYDLKRRLPNIPYTKRAAAFRRVDHPESKLFKKLLEECPRPEFATRIDQANKELYVALSEGDVAGYAWVTSEEFFISEINHVYPLCADEFFIYDCFVAPEYRGEGIYPAMLRQILADYGSNPRYRVAYIGVWRANAGSARGIQKAGFEEHSRIGYLKCLTREKWWGAKHGAVTDGAAGSTMNVHRR